MGINRVPIFYVIPKDLSFLELWKWLKPLQDVEKQRENDK